MIEIFKEFNFESAHWLPHVPDGHKCRHMHGHSFKLIVRLRGLVNNKSGMLMDFAELREIVKQVILDRLDHRCLNDVHGLENPTSENIAFWCYAELRSHLWTLDSVEVRETATSGAVYRGGR